MSGRCFNRCAFTWLVEDFQGSGIPNEDTHENEGEGETEYVAGLNQSQGPRCLKCGSKKLLLFEKDGCLISKAVQKICLLSKQISASVLAKRV